MANSQNHDTFAEIAQIDEKLERIASRIEKLEQEQQELEEYRQTLLNSLDDGNNNQNNVVTPDTDFSRDDFTWSAQMRQMAQKCWGITSYRDRQINALNAICESKRDVYVLMATGSGKSLCYQLPALLSPGITLVVSPLLSLIRDQAYHLERANVGVGMLTSATSKEEYKRIMTAMLGPVATKTTKKKSTTTVTPAPVSDQQHPELKLVYVTPEKISKSKSFMNQLEKVYAAGRLSRIVVDECHCASNMGHDFRPDYKKLGVLRIVFPNTPIVALTATSPPNVTQSVLETLNLQPIGGGPKGTIFVDSPLYRPNLRYSVMARSADNATTYAFLVKYIQAKHSGSTGIIYCLSRKDTHLFAQGIVEASGGRIQAHEFHADLEDESKLWIHEQWMSGKIQVVCATIAFGLGINHPNVRFVIHACMAKSLEGYYQESGRAGRDGEPADCVLLYRDQDAARLSTLCVTEPEGIKNVQRMIEYAQDIETCRHQLFDVHFSKHAKVRLPPCGTCDNCLLSAELVVTESISIETKALCLLLKKLTEAKERVTLNKLVEAWRGTGPLRVLAKSAREEYNTEPISTAKFSKDDQDRIINHLITKSYLREDFHFTAYSTLSYIVNGHQAESLIRNRLRSDWPGLELNFCKDGSRIADENWELDQQPGQRASSGRVNKAGSKKRAVTSMDKSSRTLTSNSRHNENQGQIDEWNFDRDIEQMLDDDDDVDNNEDDVDDDFMVGNFREKESALPHSRKRHFDVDKEKHDAQAYDDGGNDDDDEDDDEPMQAVLHRRKRAIVTISDDDDE